MELIINEKGGFLQSKIKQIMVLCNKINRSGFDAGFLEHKGALCCLPPKSPLNFKLFHPIATLEFLFVVFLFYSCKNDMVYIQSSCGLKFTSLIRCLAGRGGDWITPESG